jgi:hypothetical protein
VYQRAVLVSRLDFPARCLPTRLEALQVGGGRSAKQRSPKAKPAQQTSKDYAIPGHAWCFDEQAAVLEHNKLVATVWYRDCYIERVAVRAAVNSRKTLRLTGNTALFAMLT